MLGDGIEFNLEPDESLIGEYETKYFSRHDQTLSVRGRMIVTSKRILFYNRQNVALKLLKKIAKKDDSPLYQYRDEIELKNISRLKHGSQSFEKYVEINGRKVFLLNNTSNRSVRIVIKNAIKSLKNEDQFQKNTSNETTIETNIQEIPKTEPINRPILNGKVFCTRCGKDNDPEARFCNACGSEMKN